MGRPRVVLALAVLTILTCGCSAHEEQVDEPRVWSPAETIPFGYAFVNTEPGEHYLFGDIQLCIANAYQAVVTDVAVTDATGGLRVTGFATRLSTPGQIGVGNEEGPIGQSGFADSASPHVTGTCVDGQEPVGPTDLMVEFTKSEDSTAAGSSLLVFYVADGLSNSLTLQMEVALCSPKGPVVEICE